MMPTLTLADTMIPAIGPNAPLPGARQPAEPGQPAPASSRDPERRILVLAPLGKVMATVRAALQDDRLDHLLCADLQELIEEQYRGVAALLLTEEAMAEGAGIFADLVRRQPPWSDLPILLLTGPGEVSPDAAWAVETLGNVTLLELPLRKLALQGALRNALRARIRQYQARAHLAERERIDRQLDEFVALLGHELRNPLAPLSNSLSLVRMRDHGRPAPEVWELMHRQVSHLVRLVDDLMDVSRVTRGKIALRRQTVELATVIDAAVEACRPMIESARHRLSVTVPSERILVNADVVRLAQVFSNLLDNAAKYMDPGGEIVVSTQRDQDTAIVTVSDCGVGIVADALPRVFDLFFQAESRDRRAQMGLGIGLTQVKTLVAMHGGTVMAESEGRGKGSRFQVRLPLAQDRPSPVSAPRRPAPAVIGTHRAMVVDDNRDAAASLGTLLQLLGAEVRVAHDGPGALETSEQFRPRVMFIDLGMPGMDGYELAHRIRAGSDAGEIVLVAVTGFGRERDRARAHAAGFDHHLVKPADVADIQALLASLSALPGPSTQGPHAT